jgi:glycosyltransferase involved in cell wall biosynthesis
MPVFNEDEWVRRSLAALRMAAEAARVELDVIVVDDGSTGTTPAVLAQLAASTGIRVLTQPNSGRFAARHAGVEAATGPWVLLLDSRVEIQPGALTWLRAHVSAHPERRAWNGHVDVQTRGNPFAAFWSGLVKIGWRHYAARPRLASFGIEEFDRFPKGTGAFVLNRDLFLEAAGGFRSMFDNVRLASDDTRLLRNVAAKERIWISPDFAFRYHGKTGLRGFLRQSYFRGTTFVDGYLGQPGPIRRLLIGAIVGAAGIGALLVAAPLIAAGLVVAGYVAVPTVVGLAGGTWPEVRAAATLTPLFVAVFGAGVVRGLFLAVTRAVRPRTAAPA